VLYYAQIADSQVVRYIFYRFFEGAEGGDATGRRSLMQIPLHPADISADWLTDTLRTAGVLAAARVSAIEFELLRGDKGAIGQIARPVSGQEPPACGRISWAFSAPFPPCTSPSTT
jgi:hypothetical protein